MIDAPKTDTMPDATLEMRHNHAAHVAAEVIVLECDDCKNDDPEEYYAPCPHSKPWDAECSACDAAADVPGCGICEAEIAEIRARRHYAKRKPWRIW